MHPGEPLYEDVHDDNWREKSFMDRIDTNASKRQKELAKAERSLREKEEEALKVRSTCNGKATSTTVSS